MITDHCVPLWIIAIQFASCLRFEAVHRPVRRRSIATQRFTQTVMATAIHHVESRVDGPIFYVIDLANLNWVDTVKKWEKPKSIHQWFLKCAQKSVEWWLIETTKITNIEKMLIFLLDETWPEKGDKKWVSWCQSSQFIRDWRWTLRLHNDGGMILFFTNKNFQKHPSNQQIHRH